jgi:hypothetical protein
MLKNQILLITKYSLLIKTKYILVYLMTLYIENELNKKTNTTSFFHVKSDKITYLFFTSK